MSLPYGLEKFIKDQRTAAIQRSVWFEDRAIKIYVRAGEMITYAPYELPADWQLGDKTRPGFIHGLTISNVTSKKRRKGALTHVLEEFKKLAVELGYTEIRVENAASPAIIAWCKKFNFLEKALNASDDPICARSYYLPITANGA